MVLQNKYYLREKPIERLKQIANECFLNRIDKLVPPDMIRIIQFHRDRGDLLILISGTLSFIVDIFAQSLLFDDKRGTGLEVIDGKLTGRLDSIHPYGQGKVAILNEFIEKYEIDMANSTIYANHFTDRFMMEKAGKPVAVNPDRNLLKYAKNHGWQVLNIR